MAGIGGMAAPEQAPAAAPGGGIGGMAQPPAPEAQAGVEGQQASPEEQQAYDEYVSRGILLLFDEGTQELRPGVVQMMQDEDDPAAGLGEAVGNIVSRIDDEAQKAGVEFDPAVREAAATNIFEVAAQAATNAGIHDFENDDEAFQRAYLIGVDTVRQADTAAGRVTPEKAQADMQALAQADQAGQLQAMLGGQQ